MNLLELLVMGSEALVRLTPAIGRMRNKKLLGFISVNVRIQTVCFMNHLSFASYNNTIETVTDIYIYVRVYIFFVVLSCIPIVIL